MPAGFNSNMYTKYELKQIDKLKKMEPFDLLCHWIRERYLVYRRKPSQDPPWTDDPIIRRVYFTNVFREHDKVTKWLRENIRDPLKDRPEVLFAVIAFRWFNFIPTGSALLWRGGLRSGRKSEFGFFVDWDLPKVLAFLKAPYDMGQQLFTGAFNISNSGSTKPKYIRVCEDYIHPVWEKQATLAYRLKNCHYLGEAHDVLKLLPGLGGSGFMAAQVIADLKHTYFLPKETTEDWWTWCSLGPGAKKGLNYLFGKDMDSPAPKNWLDSINRQRKEVNKRLPKLPKLDAQNFQNCLCEFSKYVRALNGERPKRSYKGTL